MPTHFVAIFLAQSVYSLWSTTPNPIQHRICPFRVQNAIPKYCIDTATLSVDLTAYLEGTGLQSSRPVLNLQKISLILRT